MLRADSIIGALYHKLSTESNAPEDGRNYLSKHVELIGIINKPLLLHLVGCLYYCFKDNLPPSTNQIVHSNTTQDYFSRLNCPDRYGTCFGLYLGHPQARQYQAHIQEDKINFKWMKECAL